MKALMKIFSGYVNFVHQGKEKPQKKNFLVEGMRPAEKTNLD